MDNSKKGPVQTARAATRSPQFSRHQQPQALPHSFRKTLAQLGERLCHTPEEFKAWSQNLGHEQVLTTFSSYGQVASARQAELIRRLGQARETDLPEGEIIRQVMQWLQDSKHRHQ